MKRSKKIGLTVIGGFAAVVVIGNLMGPTPPEPVAPAAVTAPTSTAPAPTPSARPVAAPAPPPGDTVRVKRVIDGDTFVTEDDRRVRVLGIDSCEMSTDAGPTAKTGAEGLLLGEPVTLTRELGVDTDRYGRELRYVQVPFIGDYGTYMVRLYHTGVYDGRNDASPEYVAGLVAADTDGRECDYPDQAPVITEDNYDVDTGDDNHRDGALTGGYCGRKWWC